MALNGIITETEAQQFCDAVNDIYNNSIEVEFDVIDARGTLADFIATIGQPMETDVAENGLTVHHWRKAQARKGDQRKDVTLVEFTGERVAITHS